MLIKLQKLQFNLHGLHRRRELELSCSGISITLLNDCMTMYLYRYAFVDAYDKYWSNQATGTVSEGK